MDGAEVAAAEAAEELRPVLEALLAELRAFRFEFAQNEAALVFAAAALFGATVAAVVVLCFGRWFRRG